MIRTLPLSKLLSVVTILALTISCTKYADRDEGRYNCECGTMTWDGRELEMRMAEVVTSDSINFSYHIVADLRSESQRDAGMAPKDIVIDFVLTYEEGENGLVLGVEDADFSIQEIQAPGTGFNWLFDQATYDVEISESRHVFELIELTSTRGNTTATATGLITFDLED